MADTRPAYDRSLVAQQESANTAIFASDVVDED
jgi:hypothetical protein